MNQGPGTGYAIEKSADTDFEQLFRLWREQWDYHLGLDQAYYLPRTPDGEKDLAAEIRALISSQQPRLVVARVSNRLVGFAVFGTKEAIDGDSRIRIFGNIEEIFVSAEARSQGVGDALLQAAEQHLREMGYPDIMVECSSFNDGALRFYERSGYTNRQTLLFKTLS